MADKALISKMNMADLRGLIEVALDSYRDRAFWEGYAEAKTELLKSVVISRDLEKGE